MTPAGIAGELLETVVRMAAQATAAEAQEIRDAIDEARQRVEGLPSLAASISAAAEARRAELEAAREAAARRLNPAGEPQT